MKCPTPEQIESVFEVIDWQDNESIAAVLDGARAIATGVRKIVNAPNLQQALRAIDEQVTAALDKDGDQLAYNVFVLAYSLAWRTRSEIQAIFEAALPEPANTP